MSFVEKKKTQDLNTIINIKLQNRNFIRFTHFFCTRKTMKTKEPFEE